MLHGPDTHSFMTGSEFQIVLDHVYKELQSLTASKGREYANSEDQLDNFKRLAVSLGLSPVQVLLVYLTKHLDSIHSYARNPEHELSEPIEGRIHDAILYLILLKALIIDHA